MSVLRWSSPVRQRGTTTLSPIPNEIYLEIFKSFRPPDYDAWFDRDTKRDLSNIALVCRFFCSVAVPWIFESIEFIFRTEADGPGSQSYVCFCKSIAKGGIGAKAAAQLVKRSSITSYSMDDEQLVPASRYREFLSLYSKAMWHMSNIEELILLSIPLTKDMLKTLSNLHRLKSLTVSDCSLAEDVNERQLRNLSSLDLTRLVVAFNADDDSIREGNAAHAIHRLFDHLNFNSLLELTTNSWCLVQRLTAAPGVLSLEMLDIYFVNDLEVLAAVLQHTPSLRNLRVAGVHPDPNHPTKTLDLDPKALPNLQDVEAPISLLSGIVPGRPISSLRVATLVEVPVIRGSALEAFKSSSSPISYMQIPRDFYVDFPFYKHFPDLRILQINFSRSDLVNNPQTPDVIVGDTIRDLAKSWPKHPPLHTINLEFESLGWSRFFFDLGEQYRWISSVLVPKFPTLRKCRFGDFIHWSYLEAESSWKPRIPPKYSRILVIYLQYGAGKVKYVDYDGYIEAMLREAGVSLPMSNVNSDDE